MILLKNAKEPSSAEITPIKTAILKGKKETSDYSLREHAPNSIFLTCSNRSRQRREFDLEMNYQLSQNMDIIKMRKYDKHDTTYPSLNLNLK